MVFRILAGHTLRGCCWGEEHLYGSWEYFFFSKAFFEPSLRQHRFERLPRFKPHDKRNAVLYVHAGVNLCLHFCAHVGARSRALQHFNYISKNFNEIYQNTSKSQSAHEWARHPPEHACPQHRHESSGTRSPKPHISAMGGESPTTHARLKATTAANLVVATTTAQLGIEWGEWRRTGSKNALPPIV